MNLRHAIVAVLSLLVAACAGETHSPLPLAQNVDLNRMMGPWYLIATMPNWFEKGMVAPYDVYSLRPDGDIREDFTVRQGSFAAAADHFTVHDWAEPGSGNARWRVRIFFWPLDLPFLMIYVDPDYQVAMFGEESRGLGWIYARQPVISDATYRQLLDRFQAVGYDPTLFRKFIQLPEQIGQPGFWSDGIAASAGSAPAP